MRSERQRAIRRFAYSNVDARRHANEAEDAAEAQMAAEAACACRGRAGSKVTTRVVAREWGAQQRPARTHTVRQPAVRLHAHKRADADTALRPPGREARRRPPHAGRRCRRERRRARNAEENQLLCSAERSQRAQRAMMVVCADMRRQHALLRVQKEMFRPSFALQPLQPTACRPHGVECRQGRNQALMCEADMVCLANSRRRGASVSSH